MMKAGRYKDLRCLLSRCKGLDNYWDSYKLTLRLHYIISDIALWCDYVDMLKRLGKDIHNPKYICPSDLRGEHDKREAELRRQREREALERKREKAMVDEERFRELKSKFFGICFTNSTIQVRVLESEQEYLEKDTAMHHCLFASKYHLKSYSFFLAASINGKRMENIELNLETLKVVQSHGICNSTIECHDPILQLVQCNIEQTAQYV